MEPWEKLKLDISYDADERFWISMFVKRSRDLERNWKDFHGPNRDISVGFSRTKSGVVSSTKYVGNRYRFNGLLVDYRVFVLNNEKTNFHFNKNLLCRKVSTIAAGAIGKFLNDNWRVKLPNLSWHGHSADKLLDVLINGVLFHNDMEKAKEFDEISKVLLDSAYLDQISLVIYDRMRVARMLSKMIEPAAQGEHFVLLPPTLGALLK